MVYDCAKKVYFCAFTNDGKHDKMIYGILFTMNKKLFKEEKK